MIPEPTSHGMRAAPNINRAAAPPPDDRLREAAISLEASFLSEMLKSAGLGKPGDSFNGGAGEEQFSSFLRDAQAMEMARAGGIGLAQTLFQAMAEVANDPAG